MNTYPGSTRCHTLNLIARFMLLLTFVALISGIFTPATSMAQHTELTADMDRIPGHLVPLLHNAHAVGATSLQQMLHLSVALKLRNTDALDTLLTEQNDPTSPQYHHYLNQQSFTEQFGPTQATVNAVVGYLHSQNFSITAIAPNHLLISTSGTVAITQQAFKTSFSNYQVEGRVVYAPTVDPALPASLLDTVQLIGGLNNVAQYHPLNLVKNSRPHFHQLGPAGGFTPSELRSAYDVQPLLNSGNDGTGLSVGLFELDGYNPADINTYLQQFKLGPPKYSSVLVDGASDQPGRGAPEVELDMETLSAMAPGATQKVYIGPNSLVGESDVFNRIVTDNLVKIVTISWGECELAAVPARLDALDNIFKQGIAQGQIFFAASGDTGAYDCNDNNISVDSVASDPYVIGVGGTSLHLGPNNSYGNETAWEETSTGGNSGGGGGTSTHFLRHSFQHGRNLTNTYRMVPDVSADADPLTGYAIYCTSAGSTGWMDLGGTSAAAPLWAGMAADLSQYLLKQGRSEGLSSAIITLYQLYNTPQPYPPYHDVTIGTNLYYPATVGYDLATGIGSPDLWNIARDILKLANTQGSNTITQQVLANPGFENGNSGWQEQSLDDFELVDPTNPHSGVNSAYFCGYIGCDDRITQTVILPAKAQNITLSYWVYLGPGLRDATCPDSFTAILQTPKGVPINTVQKLCSTDKTQAWTLYTFDVTTQLSHYANQAIQISFRAQKTDRQRSNFFLDDVQLNETFNCSLALTCTQTSS